MYGGLSEVCMGDFVDGGSGRGGAVAPVKRLSLDESVSEEIP